MRTEGASPGALLLSPVELAAIGAKHMPYALLGEGQESALINLPHAPGRLFSFGAFECRLDDDPRVDFMACALAADGGRSPNLGSRTFEQEYRQCGTQTSELLAAWREPSPAAEDTEGLWFEWDQQPDSTWRPFLFVRAADARWPEERSRAQFTRWLDWLTSNAEPSFVEAEVRARVLDTVERLPPEARVLHLASLTPRGVQAIRMHVSLSKARVEEFVSLRGWSASEALQDGLRAISSLPDPIGIQFDVASDGLEFLDLEIYAESDPGSDARWRGAIDWVASLPGTSRTKIESAIQWAATVRVGESGAVLVRRVSLKVRCFRDGRTACKAYLGFSPRWISAREGCEAADPEIGIRETRLF